jgi:hypothetical protein
MSKARLPKKCGRVSPDLAHQPQQVARDYDGHTRRDRPGQIFGVEPFCHDL